MKPRHLPRACYAKTPWKNGLGTTEQIAIAPDGASISDDFVWRLSFAHVESGGPFSLFGGYERILVVWHGDGLVLHRASGTVALSPLSPLRFSGDEAITGVLTGGPVDDFNVIFAPARVHAECRIVFFADDTVLGHPGEHIIVCVRGAFECEGIAVAAGDSLRVVGAASLRCTEGAAIIFDVVFTPRQIEAGGG